MKSQPTRNSWSKQSGFSLVELMVVVAIIGVLASLAVPRFKTFQAKARQAEAKTNLAHLYTLQQSFHADYDTYAGSPNSKTEDFGNCGSLDAGFECSANCLGFIVTPCKIKAKWDKNKRYTYSVSGTDATSTKFKAYAESQDGEENRVLPGCPVDKWSINEKKSVKAVADQTRMCQK